MKFTPRILQWYKTHQRELPWRATRDPYKIWLSEIILQQTRIAQGLEYYYRFTERFPDVQALAKASEDEVLGLWQGLGYYSRARNLHHTARVITDTFEGRFPASYHQLLQLKGIGSYTAAAIASIAFGLPFAAVDGNVTRVIARYFGIEEPVDDSRIKKDIELIAHQLLDPKNPGSFNQAMMDFGSMVCKPQVPDCHLCPFSQDCKARIAGKTDTIPVKSKKIHQKKRYFHFFLLHCNHSTSKTFFIEKRDKNDIWKNLYQLPLLETNSKDLDWQAIRQHPALGKMAVNGNSVEMTGLPVHYSHQLTHQRLEAFFYQIAVPKKYCSIFENDFLRVGFEQFEQMGKPALITKYLESVRITFS